MSNQTKRQMIVKHFLLLFVGVLLITSTTSTVGQSTDITFPNFELEEHTLNVNSDNDIFIQAEPYHDLLNYGFSFNASSMNQRTYDGLSQSGVTQRDADEVFTIGSSGIETFLNITSNGQELTYTRNYFGLVSSNSSSLNNLFLEAGNSYLASFEIGENEPVYFSFLFSQISGATDLFLDISVVDPLGNTDAVNNINVQRNIHQVVPFMSEVAGTHFISIETDTDAILDNFRYVIEPEVQTISSGYIDSLQEDRSLVRFLKIENPEAQVVDLSAFAYFPEHLVNTLGTTTTLGSLDLVYFSPNGFMFGGAVPTAPFVSSSDLYIALVALAEDKDDPVIQLVELNDGYDKLMDIEVTISIRNYSFDALPIGENFETTIIDPYSSATNLRYYSFQTSETLLVGVNSSSANVAPLRFISSDPEIGTINVDADLHDPLNVLTDPVRVIPAGTYAVEAPTEETFYVATFQPATLNIGSLETISGTFGDILTFYFPATEIVDNRIDVTYLDKLNETVTIDFRWYDDNGAQINDFQDTLFYYYDAGPTLQDNNETSTTPGGAYDYDLEGMYLKLEITGNGWYNETNTPVYQDATNITSQLLISRINQFRELQENNPLDAYYFEQFDNTLLYNTFSDNNTIQVIMDFTSEANKVYKLTIDSTNRTIGLSGNGDPFDNGFYLFVDNAGSWFSAVTQNTGIVVEEGPRNITHYILEVIFATTEEIHMGMFLNLDTVNANGTLDITLTELAVTTLPGLDIANLSSEGFVELGEGAKDDGDDDDQGGIFSNPLFYAAVVGGAGIIAALVYFIIRRGGGAGKTPF